MISLLQKLFPDLDGGLTERRNRSDSSLDSPRCLVQSLTFTNASFTGKGPQQNLFPKSRSPFLGVKALAVPTEMEWGVPAPCLLATHTKSWLHFSSCFQKGNAPWVIFLLRWRDGTLRHSFWYQIQKK